MKFLIEIKRLFFKCISFFGYKVVGIKKSVKHNNLDSIINFLLEDKGLQVAGGGVRLYLILELTMVNLLKDLKKFSINIIFIVLNQIHIY